LKDPLDDRLDPYNLLNCAETCTRADAQRNYTAQLVRRAAPQRDLQAAREILVHPEQRMMYDVFLYNFAEDICGTESSRAVELDLEIDVPLPDLSHCAYAIDFEALAASLKFDWATPEPPDLTPLFEAIKPVVPEAPIEFDT
jgi:hypothetical protein